MKDAWRIARAAAARFGGRVRHFFGPALRQAWAAARQPIWTVKAGRSAGLVSHKVVEGVLVVVTEVGRYPDMVRGDGIEMNRANRIQIAIHGSSRSDSNGVRHLFHYCTVTAYSAAGSFKSVHDKTDYSMRIDRPLAELVAEGESHIPAALTAIRGIDAEFASAEEIVSSVHVDMNAETMTRERYVALADKWDFFAQDDGDLSTWGDFRFPEQAIDRMPRLLINQKRAFRIQDEKQERQESSRRERAEREIQERQQLADRPVVRTYTRKVARYSGSFVENGELHVVVADRRIGRVSEDDPSIYGSHLLGYEGSPLFEITVEVRA